MRARSIKPGFFLNSDLSDCGPDGQLLFIGLWMLADREGRLQERPKEIDAQVFPYRETPINDLLEALQSRGFILRYEVENKRFIQIINFKKHQNPHKNERESTIPKPESSTCSKTPVITRVIPSISGHTRAESILLTPESSILTPESKRPRAQKRRAADTNPEIRPLIGQFLSDLRSKLKEEPVFNGGAAGRGLAVLLGTFSADEIRRRMRFWFETQDPFVQKRSWRIEDFISNFNGLKDGPLQSGGFNGQQRDNQNRAARYRESAAKFAGIGRRATADQAELPGVVGSDGGNASPGQVPSD